MMRSNVPFPVRRSKLLVSPLDAAAIEQAAWSGADALVLDLGYAMLSAQHSMARSKISEAVRQLSGCGAELLVWVDVEQAATNVETCALPEISGLLTQVSQPEEVVELDVLLTAAERAHGWAQGRLDLELVLGCARAVLDVESLAKASPRVVALSLDEEGLLAEMQVERSQEVDQLLYARGRIVVAARVAGVQAHGLAFVMGGGTLQERARRAWLLGLRGSLCSDPADVPALNEGFTPTAAEMEHACTVKEAMEAGIQQGLGAVALTNGVMVDLAMLKHSQAVLEWAGAVKVREVSRDLSGTWEPISKELNSGTS